MAVKILLFYFLCFFFLSFFLGEKQVLVEGTRDAGFKPRRILFVFGDSYAATGNNDISLASSWKFPYGITFPGKPTGRYSDGRVLTDYFAHFLGIKSPVAYRWRKALRKIHLHKFGMNFAYGGTGVFRTLLPGPNMTTQIDSFQGVRDSFYTKTDLCSSVALVSVVGNDYSTYLVTNGSFSGFPPFIKKVVDQIEINLKRIHDLGVRKVVVTALQPLGCLPGSTVGTSFRQCNETENFLVSLHNQYLQQAVARLNAQSNSSFVILDLYTAFSTVFNKNQVHQGNPSFVDVYKPCCAGVSAQYSCGSVDDKGAKMYTLCADRSSSFFWDDAHPTQAGWHAVCSTLAVQSTLKQI